MNVRYHRNEHRVKGKIRWGSSRIKSTVSKDLSLRVNVCNKKAESFNAIEED